MKKRIIAFAACLLLLGAAPPALSDVTGRWYISGKLTVTAKAKGMKAAKFTDLTYDYLDLNADHTFLMELAAIDGTWSQTGKKWYATSVDYSDVEAFFEDYFADYGYDVLCTVTTCTASGNEGKGGIKGKVTVKATFVELDYGLSGFATAKYVFTGVPVSQNVRGFEGAPPKTLKAVIAEGLDKAFFRK